MKYLKLVEGDVGEFCRACREMDAVYDADAEEDGEEGVTKGRLLEVWSALVDVVQKAWERNEFPYDPTVLLRRLRRVIQVMETYAEVETMGTVL